MTTYSLNFTDDKTVMELESDDLILKGDILTFESCPHSYRVASRSHKVMNDANEGTEELDRPYISRNTITLIRIYNSEEKPHVEPAE